jgi:hypothetical protein
MRWLQWLPLIATLGLIYFLRWWHIGVINFKIFVLIIVVWSLFLILFYRITRPAHAGKARGGDPLEVGLSSDE